MTTRTLDFSDGFQSAAAPTEGTIQATSAGAYADDSAFVTAKGSAAAVGDIYFNTTTGFFRVHNGTQFDDYVNATDNQTVSGDKTFDGTTLFINTTNLEVTDKNININDGGNDATAEGAGINVERSGTDGSLVYEDALASKWKAGAAGSEIELANVSSAQTLTNKTVNGNNNTLTVLASSQLSGATPIANGGTGQTTQTEAFDALSPSTTKGDVIAHNGSDNVRVAVGTDGQALVADSASAAGVKWDTIVGGGGGGINHIDNPDAEVDVTGWANYADAAGVVPVDGTGGAPIIAIFRSTSGPLRGTGQFALIKGAADRQGEGSSYDFTIDSADKNKVLTVSFDYADDNTGFAYNGGVPGDESDIMIYVYDVTNAALIRMPVEGLDGSGRFISTFQATDSTSYRLIYHIATTNAAAWGFTFDNVSVGPSAVAVFGEQTDWISFTPTFTGLGTPTDVNIFYKRNGDSLEIRGSFLCGTVSGSGAPLVGLPSGLSIDTNKIDTSADNSGFGTVFRAKAAATAALMVADSNSGIYYGGYDGADGTVVQIYSRHANAVLIDDIPTQLFANGDRVIVNWSGIPISGWSSGRESLVAVDAARPVVASYRLSSNQTVTTGSVDRINYDTKVIDTHSAVTTGASWKFVTPVTGHYQVSFHNKWAEGTGWDINEVAQITCKVNGGNAQLLDSYEVFSSDATAQSIRILLGGTRTIKLNAGDEVTFEATQNSGSNKDLELGESNYCSISKIDTGAALAALSSVGKQMVEVNTSNGYGSTNTVIRRYTNVVTNAGPDITYTDSATDGGSFTINAAGVYALSCYDNFDAVNTYLGWSRNSTQLTTSIINIAVGDRLAVDAVTGAANTLANASWTGFLDIGDVLRVHTSGQTTASTARAGATVTRVN